MVSLFLVIIKTVTFCFEFFSFTKREMLRVGVVYSYQLFITGIILLNSTEVLSFCHSRETAKVLPYNREKNQTNMLRKKTCRGN